MKIGIAFFDLDGTITKKDTFIDFIIYVNGRFNYFKGLIILSPWIFLYFIKIFPNYRLKEKFFKYYLSKYPCNKLNTLGKEYAINIIPTITYKEAINRIEWHRNNDHRIIILTASSPIWLSEWCSSNKIEIIGTEFESINGKYTGKIKGKNCHGREKLKIVSEILASCDATDSFGYGDSKSDLYFMKALKKFEYRGFKS